MSARQKALDNKCPSCGAPIKFNAKTQNFKCEYCFSEYTLEEMKKYNNASNEEANKKEEPVVIKKDKKDDTTYVTYLCKNCNAEIIADENTAATFCVYCGNTAILKDKLSGKFAPSKIIPFKKTKENAIEAFKSLKKGKPLVPKDFISEKNIEKITGVYIPFWLYDIKVSGLLEAKSTHETTWTSGNYTYVKTDIYKMESDGEMTYYKVPVDGSTRFDDDIMNSIEPFDYKDLEEYNHAYLSGFLAEKYDVEKNEAKKITIERAEKSTYSDLQNKATGYNSFIPEKKECNIEEEQIDYVLLPVWMVNIRYKDKLHTFAMNGQTGKMIGDIPYSKAKAVIYSALIFIVLFAIIAFITYLI